MLKDVHDRLAEESLRVRLTEAALNFLVDRGYDEKFGARPLRRAIQRFIEDPLSEKILGAEFPAGEEVEVDVAADGEKLDFKVFSTKA
jgi:ATP-dependent Clp protease ATP-binding subunit ClpC